MEPAYFAEANRQLIKPDSMTEEECSSLFVWSEDAQCISLWKLNWRERLSALLFGNIWLTILSGETQPPVAMQAAKTIFEEQ